MKRRPSVWLAYSIDGELVRRPFPSKLPTKDELPEGAILYRSTDGLWAELHTPTEDGRLAVTRVWVLSHAVAGGAA